MELKIINRESYFLNEQFGLSMERIDELTVQMDLLIKEKLKGEVFTCDVFNEIAGLCNTVEEYTFCMVSHVNLMSEVYGLVYVEPENKKPIRSIKKSGIDLIAIERQEQSSKHNYNIDHDFKANRENQLIRAAVIIIDAEHNDIGDWSRLGSLWPHPMYLNIINKTRVEQLAIAGALIAAEIDRLIMSYSETN